MLEGFDNDPGRRQHLSHHRRLFDERFPELVDHAAACLRRLRRVLPFDAVAGRGVSGVVLAAALSYRLEAPLVVVRKPDERAHDSFSAVGYARGSRCVLVDDLIATGATVRTVARTLAEHGGSLVAVCLYSNVGWFDDEWLALGFPLPPVKLPIQPNWLHGEPADVGRDERVPVLRFYLDPD